MSEKNHFIKGQNGISPSIFPKLRLLSTSKIVRGSWFCFMEVICAKEKKKKGERGREKKGESKGAAYFLRFELTFQV